jgi:aminomethyltransferase
MKQSPLRSEHEALGARLVEFGGWEMPLFYPPGSLDEHVACRHRAVMFDVSHLGTVRVHGPDALRSLQLALTNDLTKIGPGRAQYTHLCNDAGGVEDDIIVWWVGEDRFDVMPNASNTERVIGAIGGVDVTARRAVIAVQGPQARERVARACPAAAAVGRFRVAEVDWNGVGVTVAGTGYTGEDGIEIAVPSDDAARVWRDLAEAGVEPAGLGARDTLRLEAALPLHGHELSADISPLQAGLGWVVAWGKDQFRGRDALVAERAAGPSRVLRGIATEGRRPPRADAIVNAHGSPVGVVTSGNFSPMLEHGIALALVDPSVVIGDDVDVSVRGNVLPGRVVPTPFVAKSGG